MGIVSSKSAQLTPSRARSQEKLAANVRKLWKMTSREFGERLAAFEAWEDGERLQLAELGKRIGDLEFQLAVLRAVKAVEPLRQVNDALYAADEAERQPRHPVLARERAEGGALVTLGIITEVEADLALRPGEFVVSWVDAAEKVLGASRSLGGPVYDVGPWEYWSARYCGPWAEPEPQPGNIVVRCGP